MRPVKLSLNRKIVKSKLCLKNKRAHDAKHQYKFGIIQPGNGKYSNLLNLSDILWGHIFKHSSMYDIYMFKSVFNVNVLLPPVMALVKDPHSFDMCDKRFDYRVTTIVNPCIYSFKDKNFIDLYNEHVNLTVCDIKSKLGLFNKEFSNPMYDYITFISLNNMIKTGTNSCEIKSYSIDVPENYSVVEYTYLCINDVLYGTRPLLNKFNFTTPLPFNCIIKQYLLIKSDMVEACVLDNNMPVNGCCEYYNANPNEYLCMDKKLTKDFVYYHDQVYY
ncbi:unknown [Choristoneura fumiferana DEF multiple nucleopolyhedrovirus]|uniref:Uncharacterized protein n=1 Tax=Choristoneura fumiferana defective polyhedrosis virus TaxID=74660 RepID=Q6VTJ4_NPVCD|nr:hypothetical protein CFDNVgORF145 [Choristoneura fumiferana DEF multiple nucleopolyhedrovirus]AAQ91690.1 unknown [Choristoneura fumiferana DEF multiple nucleopolyhedrovirus]